MTNETKNKIKDLVLANSINNVEIIDLLVKEQLEPIEEVPELPTDDDILKPRLGIIVGHSKTSSGAMAFSGESEYEYGNKIANLMCCISKKIETVKILRDGVGISGAYEIATEEKCDAVIELHFNCFNGQVQGTEVLCTYEDKDILFSEKIQDQMLNLFKLKDRGVKSIPRNARGGGNVHGFPSGVNTLVEPFFGDHPSSHELMKMTNEYAACLIDGVEKFYNL